VNEAHRQLAARICERDAVASDVADAVARLLTQLEDLAAARETAAAALDSFRVLAGRSGVGEAPPEPEALQENWEQLIEHIRNDLGAELEQDLIEAAARSPFGDAINDLPAYLRALATERRRALMKESMSRKDEPTIPGPPSPNV
jgi:hypothetical protein